MAYKLIKGFLIIKEEENVLYYLAVKNVIFWFVLFHVFRYHIIFFFIFYIKKSHTNWSHCAVRGVCQLVSQSGDCGNRKEWTKTVAHRGGGMGCSVPCCPFGPTVHTTQHSTAQQQQKRRKRELVLWHPARTCTPSTHTCKRRHLATRLSSVCLQCSASAPCALSLLLAL